MIAATLTQPDPSPCFSEESVKIALDALLSGVRAQSDRSLENLLLVDEILMDAAFPPSGYRRDYALAHLLSSAISEELKKLRRVFGIHPEPDDSLEAAKQAIGRDKQIASTELLGWSWLYYHYVRVELEMSRALFCQLASIELRTLLRYQQHAVRRLTGSLMEREWLQRRQRHKRRLYTRLPTLPPISFCGRNQALKQVGAMYGRSGLHYFQVFGEAGIGKTAFVQKAVGSMIDREAIDELIWLEAPVSSERIHQHLQQVLHELGAAISMREYTQSRRVAFVFDGLDAWEEKGKTLETLLSDLGAAVVFLTASDPLPLGTETGCIALSELPAAEAKHLIRRLLNHWYIPCFESTNLEVDSIWEQVGGNPRRITQAVFDLQRQHSQMDRNYSSNAPL
ncbi:MAG: hypothetical protein ABI700_06280 [Chloroflexota bacterium]